MKRSQEDIKQEIDEIKSVLKEFPKGARIEEIKQRVGFSIGVRLLQRRLKELKDQGIIDFTGKTKAARYYLKEIAGQTEVKQSESIRKQSTIVLSADSKAWLEQVSQPLENRKAVSYQRSFLEDYQPNTVYYLSRVERDRLMVLGNTLLGNQPAGTYAREILNRLLIDLSWNSSRLEGNTYTLLDTQLLIDAGKKAEGKSAADAQMILNHKDAIEFLVDATGSEDIGFNRYTITNLHAILSNNLLSDPEAPGRLRKFAVGISQSTYTPLTVPQQIEEMFDLMLAKAQLIKDPFEQAFFIMVHLPYLQPFEDVNKRVSRLAANIPLNQHNLVPLSFIDVPHDLYIKGLLAVYEENSIRLLKEIFIWTYQRSAERYANVRQTLGEPDELRMQYRDEMRALISNIIVNVMDKAEAKIVIESEALKLSTKDRERFIEIVETELLSLHEGNFARYKIRPSQFIKWKENWKSK